MGSGVKWPNDNVSRLRLPSWLRRRLGPLESLHSIKSSLRSRGLNTVCEEAKCPNIGECFERGTATVMIMGNTCTRDCGFCGIATGDPTPLDANEPANVAMQVMEMGLKHAVVTSVTRDDLRDGGAAHFAKTIVEIKRQCPDTRVEVLTPDFEGREGDILTICSASPDVFNHNLETVERLTKKVRNKADYHRSLSVLRTARRLLPKGRIKSGLMVGLGETEGEVERTLTDLKDAGCDIVTIGQYLKPSKDALPVAEYITPKTFHEYEAFGLKLGFKTVIAGPFVRSSYLADQVMV